MARAGRTEFCTGQKYSRVFLTDIENSLPLSPVRSHTRYLQPQVKRNLARKMVFVAGPRQVGKTTVARALPGGTSGYLSWDDAEDREKILRRQLPSSTLWVFDELHKYRHWHEGLPDRGGHSHRAGDDAAEDARLIARPSSGLTRGAGGTGEPGGAGGPGGHRQDRPIQPP